MYDNTHRYFRALWLRGERPLRGVVVPASRSAIEWVLLLFVGGIPVPFINADVVCRESLSCFHSSPEWPDPACHKYESSNSGNHSSSNGTSVSMGLPFCVLAYRWRDSCNKGNSHCCSPSTPYIKWGRVFQCFGNVEVIPSQHVLECPGRYGCSWWDRPGVS